MFDRFTDRARKVMSLANQEAQRWNYNYVEPVHILLGLIKEGGGVGSWVLRNLLGDLPTVRRLVEKVRVPGPDLATMGRLPLNAAATNVVLKTSEQADRLGHTYRGTEHICLGLMDEPDADVAKVLAERSLLPGDITAEVLLVLGLTHDGKPRAVDVKQATPTGVLVTHQEAAYFTNREAADAWVEAHRAAGVGGTFTVQELCSVWKEEKKSDRALEAL